jgi:hypothetical protein
MASNKAERDVHIVDFGGEFRVRPAVAAVKGGTSPAPGGTVSFRNATDYDVTVAFPSGIVLAGDPSTQTMKKNKTATFTLDPLPSNDSKVIIYHVVVFTKDGPIVATGESGPRLIIDP